MQKIHNNNLDLSQFYHLDINLYPLFIAIYQQKSISKAAKILCISQSAASHALQRLRQQLKDELFLRVGQQMHATPFSEQIYPRILNALTDLQNLQPKSEFNPADLEQLTIAIHDEIEAFALPKIWQYFQQFNPHLQIQSLKLNRKTLSRDLVTQQLDLAIDFKQDLSQDVHFQALFSDEFVLCSQSSNINLNDYLQAPHIGVSSRRSGLLLEDLFLAQHQLKRSLLMRCQHYSTALQMLILQPESVLTLPKNILAHLHLDARLHISPLPIRLAPICLGMYSAAHLHMQARQRCIRTHMQQLFQA